MRAKLIAIYNPKVAFLTGHFSLDLETYQIYASEVGFSILWQRICIKYAEDRQLAERRWDKWEKLNSRLTWDENSEKKQYSEKKAFVVIRRIILNEQGGKKVQLRRLRNELRN